MCVCVLLASSYPATLLLGAVGVAVQAGEDGARRHQLTGFVPAVGVAEPGGVALTLLVQHGVKSVRQREEGESLFDFITVTQFLLDHTAVAGPPVLLYDD